MNRNHTTPIATRIDSEIYRILNNEISECKSLSPMQKKHSSISGWNLASQRKFIESAVKIYLRDKGINYDVFKIYLNICAYYQELDVKKQAELREKTGFNPNSFSEFFESAVLQADEIIRRLDAPIWKKYVEIR